MSLEIKQKLYQHCLNNVQERMRSIQAAIQSAQEASNKETKSTAGDKHDTSRAMMQLEVEQKSKQLAETEKLKKALTQFSADRISTHAELGSLVTTNIGNYYISLGLGRVSVDDKNYFFISPMSPIAQLMKDKVVGDTIEMNGKTQEILEII